MKKKALILSLLLAVSTTFSGCGEKTEQQAPTRETKDVANAEISQDEETTTEFFEEEEETTESYQTYTLGDTFEFNELEITLNKKCTFTKIDNEYSDYHKKTVIRIPVTIKNVGNKKNHLSSIDYDTFGSKGTELDGISSYFDDCVDYAGDLKPNASYETYFYVLYDGDGTYSIDFDNYKNQLSVEFNIKK